MADPIHAFEPDGTPSPGAQAALDGKADVSHTHPWGDVEGKPTEFPAETHTHTVEQVDGLEDRLANLEADTGWVGLTLSPGVTEYGAPGAPAQIRKAGDFVHLRGRITRTDGEFPTGTTVTVCNLPSHLRPIHNLRPIFSGGTSSQWGRAEISSVTGNIELAAISGDLGWVELSGIYWTIN